MTTSASRIAIGQAAPLTSADMFSCTALTSYLSVKTLNDFTVYLRNMIEKYNTLIHENVVICKRTPLLSTVRED